MTSVLALLSLFALGSQAVRFVDPAYPIEVQKEIVYKEADDYAGKRIALKLDVYRPKDGRADRPAVIWVHGGSLMFGNKDDQGPERDFCEKLAKRGYVTVNIDYRLRPDPNPTFNDAMRDAMEDVQSALAWLRTNAKEQGVDVGKVALAGYSAGGEIVTNLCYTKHVPSFDASQVRAVLDFAGNTLFWGEPEKGAPPCMIVHGTKDDINPFSASENLKSRLEKQRVLCELFAVEGADHFFNRDQAHFAKIEVAVAKFLKAHVADRAKG